MMERRQQRLRKSSKNVSLSQTMEAVEASGGSGYGVTEGSWSSSSSKAAIATSMSSTVGATPSELPGLEERR